MAGTGYDIGASIAASASSSATGGQTGANSVTDNSGSGTSQQTIIIVAIALFVGLVFWTMFHDKK